VVIHDGVESFSILFGMWGFHGVFLVLSLHLGLEFCFYWC
jgi:hypothetical protein